MNFGDQRPAHRGGHGHQQAVAVGPAHVALDQHEVVVPEREGQVVGATARSAEV